MTAKYICNGDHFLISEPKSTTNNVIVTLGNPDNPVTCSMDVALSRFPRENVYGAESFEEAQFILAQGAADLLLVPGAYARISEFLMREDMAVVDCFACEIPELVFVAGGNMNVDERKVLYFQPATMSLIKLIDGYFFDQIEPVSSNQKAVEALLDFKQPDLVGAITNRLVADKYGVDIIQVLRSARKMSFVLFRKTGVGGVA